MKKISDNFWSQLINSKLFIIIVLFLVVFAALALFKSLRSRNAVEQDIKRLKQEIEALETQNLELAQMINYLQSEEFTELEAKEKFNLQKPGEKVVAIARSEEELRRLEAGQASEPGAGGNMENKNKGMANPIRWWNYFFAR